MMAMASAETREAAVSSTHEVKHELNHTDKGVSAELRRKYIGELRKTNIPYFLRTAIERLTRELEFHHEGGRVVPLPTLVSQKTAEYAQKNLKQEPDTSNIKKEQLIPPWLVNQLLNIRLGLFEGIVRPEELSIAATPASSPFMTVTNVSLESTTSPLELPPLQTPSTVSFPPSAAPHTENNVDTSQPAACIPAEERPHYTAPREKRRRTHEKVKHPSELPEQPSVTPVQRVKKRRTSMERRIARRAARNGNGEATDAPLVERGILPDVQTICTYLNQKTVWPIKEALQLMQWGDIAFERDSGGDRIFRGSNDEIRLLGHRWFRAGQIPKSYLKRFLLDLADRVALAEHISHRNGQQ